MVRVFLSYSHDDETHRERVHTLADCLRRERDLQVILDRDVGPGGPDEGWPAWSERQVLEADRVLIACSEQYALRYQGNDDDSDRGRGTVIEAGAIQQFLYESKGRNARFRVVLLDASHVDHIPHQLRRYHYFTASEEKSYRELLAWLRAPARDVDAEPTEGPIWPPPDPDFRPTLADRRHHFDAIRAALSGQSSNRIFLLEGEGASGKTEFLNELSAYADRLEIPCTRFDFKGSRSIEEFFEEVVLDLGDRLRATRDAKSKTPLVEFVTDLRALTTPVLLLFDTFEKVSEEARLWLETKLLPRVRNLPAVVVVIGGRTVPQWRQYPWKTLTDFRQLERIQDPQDWTEYIDRVHKSRLEPHQIQTLTAATQGVPGNMRPLLETLMSLSRSKNDGTE